MDGVAVIRKLMLSTPIPGDRIRAGLLPQGTTLPGLSIMMVSSVDRNILDLNRPTRMVTDRVQVTVLAKDYPSLRATLAQVKQAGGDKLPEVDGISDVAVLTDGQGPDFLDETSGLYLGTQDFRVSYTQAKL